MLLVRCGPTQSVARRALPDERRSPRQAGCTHRAHTHTITTPDGAAFSLDLQGISAEAQVYQVSLNKPLGLTLTERSGSILIDEVALSGHAAQAGITAGDVLLATTAKAQVPDAAPGVTQTVLLQTTGQTFKTVTAALRSNTCSQCRITLVLQRQPEQQKHSGQ